ncbi:DUF397 domain-containing protein [Streptomyces koyangensis]|uniref:DUF397 domain-containing protein n=1 Tax=Streptomyces koyangensis TaxID=188770 RepID=UPI003C2FCBEF
MFDPEWTKSSYSSQDAGGRVEWAPSVALATCTVPLRETAKPPRGPTSPSARPHGRSL